MLRSTTFIVCLLLAASSLDAASVTFSLNQPDPSFTQLNTNGFSASFPGSGTLLSKTGGTGNGEIVLESLFTISGDFDIEVDANGSALGGSDESGLGIDNGPMFADVFYAGYAFPQINGNLPAHPSGFGSGRTGTFRITRTGSVLSEFFDGGSGFSLVNRDTATPLTGAVRVQIFNLEELGGTDASGVTFSNLRITADTISQTPEPGAFGLMGAAGLLAAARRRIGRLRA